MIAIRKKFIFGILIILILMLAIIGFVLIKLSTQPLIMTRAKTEVKLPQQASKVTLTYDGKIFTPENLTIKINDIIILKNISNDDLQLAIGTHNKHEPLKGFEEKIVKSQKTYVFSPKEEGKFVFHNHLKENVGGNLIIEKQ